MSKNRKSNGGGWSTGPEMISPGNLVNHQYSGPGKDCSSAPVRSGFMDMYSQRGLPGLSGGKRGNKRSERRSMKRSMKRSNKQSMKYRGGTMLQPAPFEDVPVPQTSAPGVPPQAIQQPAQQPMQQPMQQPAQQPMQKGGRYGFFPEMGPLNPVNAVGASGLAPFARIPCEAGITNKLNPNMELQMATTAIRGGAFPVVNVGAADSMRYNAPTAGYRNDFEPLPAGGAVPGLMLQTPYDARSGNMACATTGGKRSRRSRRSRRVRFGGSHNLADRAAPYSQMQMEQVMNRQAFDGSNKGLPVKYGGSHKRSKRSKHNKRNKKQKSRKTRKSFWGF
jgi:hypothetical protein